MTLGLADNLFDCNGDSLSDWYSPQGAQLPLMRLLAELGFRLDREHRLIEEQYRAAEFILSQTIYNEHCMY